MSTKKKFRVMDDQSKQELQRKNRDVQEFEKNNAAEKKAKNNEKIIGDPMPKLMKFTVNNPPDEYELSLGWDDGAFVEGNIKFDVSALKRNIESQEESDQFSATVAIVPKPDQDCDENTDPYVQLVLKNEATGQGQTFNYPLKDLFEESQIIDLIPAYLFAGDPFTGCLIRSGLSTTVAQVIICKNETAGVLPWFFNRLQKLGKCLLTSIPDMTSKMARRSVRCIYNFGF